MGFLSYCPTFPAEPSQLASWSVLLPSCPWWKRLTSVSFPCWERMEIGDLYLMSLLGKDVAVSHVPVNWRIGVSFPRTQGAPASVTCKGWRRISCSCWKDWKVLPDTYWKNWWACPVSSKGTERYHLSLKYIGKFLAVDLLERYLLSLVKKKLEKYLLSLVTG